MLTACTTGDKAYVVGAKNALAVYAESAADSPGAACQAFAAATANNVSSVNEHSCVIAAGGYPILKVCEDAIAATGGGTTSGTVAVSFPPFQLDTADGSLIAGAILAVWAIGWGARMIIRALSVDGNSTKESE